jgi:hypothetical protein
MHWKHNTSGFQTPVHQTWTPDGKTLQAIFHGLETFSILILCLQTDDDTPQPLAAPILYPEYHPIH